MRHALISEQEDLAPCMGGRNFMLQTEDQPPISPLESNLDSLPFVHLEPPLSEEDYNFTLSESEGLADLFEAYDFGALV